MLQGAQPLPAQAALPSYRIDLLDAAPAGFTFGPASMNDRGAIAGLATDNSTLQQQLALYRGGRFEFLGALDSLGGFSDLREVNNRGEVVGHVFRSEGVRPFIYSRGQLSLLPLPEDARGQARVLDINNAGQLFVGYSIDRDKDANDEWGAYVYDSGRYTLVSGGNYFGVDMNEKGRAVGDFFDESGDPMIYGANLFASGQFATLDSLKRPSDVPWQLLQTFAIDNRGRVLGLGSIADNEYRFFLATPVPEPGTLGLMLAGSTLLAAAHRRRRPR
ncbi:PEP-CTERM sorting domain-containing protein [Azohydromonas australica]|uniref:PEP-CTERM sorting domain-containing protein n=1 Tax=Azohydromonas australica TaxID=364039 RepID=UPI001EE41718|nr:PEP-CTERM sorting domain-containing protein [Azohydromonas australica]